MATNCKFHDHIIKKCDDCKEVVWSLKTKTTLIDLNEHGFDAMLARPNCGCEMPDEFKHISHEKCKSVEKTDNLKTFLLKTPQIDTVLKILKKRSSEFFDTKHLTSAEVRAILEQRLYYYLFQLELEPSTRKSKHELKKLKKLSKALKRLRVSLLNQARDEFMELSKNKKAKLEDFKYERPLVEVPSCPVLEDIIGPTTTVIVLTINNCEDANILEPIRDFGIYKLLVNQLVEKDVPHIDSLRVCSIMNIDFKHCVVKVKNLRVAKSIYFVTDYCLEVEQDVDEIESMPKFVERYEIQMNSPGDYNNFTEVPEFDIFLKLMKHGVRGDMEIKFDNDIVIFHRE